MADSPLVSGSSLSDLLTAVKNLVVALNGATQAFINVNGLTSRENIAAPTLLKSTAGRVASVSVVVAGSGPGTIFDSASLQQNNPLWVIPMAARTDGEPYIVNMPCASGILIVPGPGQTLAVSWS